ncbi:MAG: TIGR00282 family metallophosphoesterase [candidate division WOR-3 bacterium]|nr:TIGR00282 family metallophosphoesterase [candidate division WOR-3 bacterium]
MIVKHILFLGDICSESGRNAVKKHLRAVKESEEIDFAIGNAENVAGGYGITPNLAQELLDAGLDCITLGDHFLDRKDIVQYLDSEPRILRPANFPTGVPGIGARVLENANIKIGIIALLGRIFLRPINCPFETALACAEKLRKETPIVIVDFHAEATAEKQALAWLLDGKVSAVVGTHTHVQTADERILPLGTAYITDVGMCGAMDSILGMRIESAIKRMVYSIPLRLEPAKDNVHLNGVIISVDAETGKALTIKRLDKKIEAPNP